MVRQTPQTASHCKGVVDQSLIGFFFVEDESGSVDLPTLRDQASLKDTHNEKALAKTDDLAANITKESSPSRSSFSKGRKENISYLDKGAGGESIKTMMKR